MTPAAAPSRPLLPPLSPRLVVLAVLAYFGAQLALRVLLSGALEIDESEQVLWSQDWAWGYGKQPPLYTWLQALVFEVTGPSVFGLALLKNTLLAGTYLLSFDAARRLMPLPQAAIGALSILLLPQIGWESQRDLTHSVLATTMAAWTLWLVVALLQRPRPLLYVALGLVLAGGTLAKYSYVLLPAAFALAALAHRDTRALVLSPWLIVSVLLAALLCLPHTQWLIQHWHAATEGTLQKLHAAEGLGPLAQRIRGLGSLALAMVAFLSPWWLIWLLVFGRTVRGGTGRTSLAEPASEVFAPVPAAALRPVFAALAGRYLLALTGLLLLMVLAGTATSFKDRWMQPYLFMLPLALGAALPRLDGSPRVRTMGRVLAVTAVLLLAAVNGRIWINGMRGSPDELNLPGVALAQAMRGAGYDGRTIVAGDQVTGAMLRVQLDARVAAWRHGQLDDVPPGPLLLVAVEEGRARNGVSLQGLAEALGRPLPDEVRRVTLPYWIVAEGTPPARYAWILLP